MGLGLVKDEIIRTAKDQEEGLLDEASKKAKEIEKKLKEDIKKLEEANDIETKKKLDVIKRQELASIELEAKKLMLEAKKKAIDEVFDLARKRIEKLDTKSREAFIKKLLEKAKKDIDVASVLSCKKDLKILGDQNSQETGIIGGLIAENKDMTVRVDYSYDSMLQNIKEAELQNINKVLFE